MKPYNRTGACAKCGSVGARSLWKSGPQYWITDSTGLIKPATKEEQDQPERIERTCIECGYVWAESPLDAKPEEKGAA